MTRHAPSRIPRRSRPGPAFGKKRHGMNFMNFASADAGFGWGQNREK
jgi:hypothetical protein